MVCNWLQTEALHEHVELTIPWIIDRVSIYRHCSGFILLAFWVLPLHFVGGRTFGGLPEGTKYVHTLVIMT